MKRPIEEKLKINTNNLKAYSSGLLQGMAYRAMNSALSKTLLPYNLSIPEWKLLGQLYDHSTIKPAELAELLNVEAPHVTTLIDQLEKKALIKRKIHPLDKRAKIIIATKKGTQLIEEIEPNVKAVMGKLLQGVTHDELVIYIRILQSIVNNSTS